VALRNNLIPKICGIVAAGAGLVGAIAPHGLWAAPASGHAQGQAQEPAIRREVNLVPVYFTVRDAKRALVTNLTKDEFHVYEDGKEQAIDTFAHESDVPLNVGVLLDTSTRMEVLLAAEADAANLFLTKVVRPTDLAFVLSFDARVNVLQEPTQELKALERGVFSITRGALAGEEPIDRMPSTVGNPAPSNARNLREAHIFDAVGVGTNRYLAPEIGRKAMVILALADDAKSETKLEDALRSLQETNTIAYVLEFEHSAHDDCDVLHIFHPGSGSVTRLAEETGGRVIKVKGRDKLRAAFEEIAEELHSQYFLGYYMPNVVRDSKFRRIDVRTRNHALKVQARKGYYADPVEEK